MIELLILMCIIAASLAMLFIIRSKEHSIEIKKLELLIVTKDIDIKAKSGIIENLSMQLQQSEPTINRLEDEIDERNRNLNDLSYYEVLETTDEELYSKVLNYFIDKIMEDNNIIPKNAVKQNTASVTASSAYGSITTQKRKDKKKQ